MQHLSCLDDASFEFQVFLVRCDCFQHFSNDEGVTNDDDVDVFQDSISSRKNADCMGGMRGGDMMYGRMMMPMTVGG